MADCALTQDYSLGCSDFFGGLNEVYIIEYSNIIGCAITTGTGIVHDITKATGTFFRKYEIEAHTGDGKEDVTVNRANGTKSVKQTVMFPINGLNVSIRNEIENIAANRLVFVIVDNNGTGWIYGKDFGMRLTKGSAATGKALSDRNGYDLSFESEEKYLAYQVDQTTLGTLQTPGV